MDIRIHEHDWEPFDIEEVIPGFSIGKYKVCKNCGVYLLEYKKGCNYVRDVGNGYFMHLKGYVRCAPLREAEDPTKNNLGHHIITRYDGVVWCYYCSLINGDERLNSPCKGVQLKQGRWVSRGLGVRTPPWAQNGGNMSDLRILGKREIKTLIKSTKSKIKIFDGQKTIHVKSKIEKYGYKYLTQRSINGKIIIYFLNKML